MFSFYSFHSFSTTWQAVGDCLETSSQASHMQTTGEHTSLLVTQATLSLQPIAPRDCKKPSASQGMLIFF